VPAAVKHEHHAAREAHTLPRACKSSAERHSSCIVRAIDSALASRQVQQESHTNTLAIKTGPLYCCLNSYDLLEQPSVSTRTWRRNAERKSAALVWHARLWRLHMHRGCHLVARPHAVACYEVTVLPHLAGTSSSSSSSNSSRNRLT
jgi:hypothetical protein